MIGRLLAFAAAIVGGTLLILRGIQRTEDREPIRIRNKKLRFDLRVKEWKGDLTGQLWRTLHPNGASVTGFGVTAIKPEGEAPFTATTVTFKVVVGGQTMDYVLKRTLAGSSGKWEPVVVTPTNIEIAEAGKRLRIRNEPDVWISHVFGDGTLRYEFDQNTGEIDLLAKPLR